MGDLQGTSSYVPLFYVPACLAALWKISSDALFCLLCFVPTSCVLSSLRLMGDLQGTSYYASLFYVPACFAALWNSQIDWCCVELIMLHAKWTR